MCPGRLELQRIEGCSGRRTQISTQVASVLRENKEDRSGKNVKPQCVGLGLFE